MNPLPFLRCLGWVAAVATAPALTAQSPAPPGIAFEHVGSYASGFYDSGGAEIVAHDPVSQRLFVVNAQRASVDILDIQEPENPIRIGEIDVTPYGAVANSVAAHAGIVAVAVEHPTKTGPGQVVFFNPDGRILNRTRVGALPDMLTFTPDGRNVLVACEGEPNADYSVDPEGSVYIIGIPPRTHGRLAIVPRKVSFTSLNDQPLDPTIRIFGPHQPTVAQDLEPEYIAVSADSRTAWVTCQENNAIAIIDIESATLRQLVGLGYKDHAAVAAAATLYSFPDDALAVLGTTLADQEIRLGGFSGLFFEGIDPSTGRYRFVTHTDRGPNAEPTGILRPFLLPAFTPEIVRFELDRSQGTMVVTERIPLQVAQGEPLTGLPNTSLSDNASQPYNDEIPVDLLGNVLPLDPLGADLEGIVVDPTDQTFWMADEYRPAIYHFDTDGILLQRHVPVGTAAAAGEPAGTFGIESLPAVLAQRRQNRGFEAIAYDAGRIYAFVQSPLRNPDSLGNAALNDMKNIRMVELNPANNTTRQFMYIMDNPNLGGSPNSRADKIGDAVALGGGEFLVIERDDDAISEDGAGTIEKKVYRFNLVGATDLSSLPPIIGQTGKSVDQLTVAELVANGIRPVEKILQADLNLAGYNTVQKVEGLAAIDPWTLAVINDNDFGVASINVHPDGSFTPADGYTPEPVVLGIIDVRMNGLDASDRDNRINIRPWPVKGLFLPDAMASFRIGGQDFLITANEGDVREYGTFAEAVRIGSGNVTLDPAIFPNAAVLKNNANLGRLNITSTLGRDSATGLYRELYAFGTRSFSLWDATGQLIYDSGDDLEFITASTFPAHFNASNTNNDFDNRSDDKGPEPEGVVVGEVSGRRIAFLGLERIGGIVAYDITDPRVPVFMSYANLRDFNQPTDSGLAGDLGPEGLLFIRAENSPNGEALLVVGNEISGTTSIFAIRPTQN